MCKPMWGCARGSANGRGIVTTTQGIKVPIPSTFTGQRDTRALDDFIWEVEQYFDGMNVEDNATEIKVATRYLKDTAALWWHRRKEDVDRGTCTIETWADFIREIKRVFYPKNAEDEVRSRLRKLKHTGTIKYYVKEFTMLTLEILDLIDEDSFFYFIDGLQPWAKTKLRRHGAQNLVTAIAEVESFIDFGTREASKPEDEEEHDVMGEGDESA